jgi:hypothetical protein
LWIGMICGLAGVTPEAARIGINTAPKASNSFRR